MTPKEKAEEMIEYIYQQIPETENVNNETAAAKNIAILFCHEIIKAGGTMNLETLSDGSKANGKLFWIDVRNEIAQL